MILDVFDLREFHRFPNITIARALLASGLALVLFVLWAVIYRLLFHPLAKFPGDRASAISQIPQTLHLLRKTYPEHVRRLHSQYGPIVRVAPNELTFCSPEAWKDIYGVQPGLPRLTKDPVLYCPDPFTNSYSLISAEGQLYQQLRRPFSSAFSQESLLKHEVVIQRHVDLLIDKLHSRNSQVVDLVDWFTWTTFDILGALAFGQSFGSLESEETHFWVSMITDAVRSGVFLRILGGFPWLKQALMHFIPQEIMDNREKHVEYSRNALRNFRDDGVTENLLSHWNAHSKNDISEDEKVILFSDMIIAGSETTATMLSAASFYLSRNQEVLSKVRAELHKSFASRSDMNARRLAELPYFNAVIEESLRIFPPVPQGLPRVVSNGGRSICGHWVAAGTIVSVHSWAITHSEIAFPKPEQFDPSRFMDSSEGKCLREGSQPFSTGPRGCIGRNLAYIEMRLILASFLWEFDVEVEPSCRDWIDQNLAGVVWEKAPLKVKLKATTG